MNKRIKELDKQAVDYAMSVCDADGVYQGKEYLTVVKEKFAQLIVQECLDIAKNWDDQLVNAKLVKESNAVGIVAYRIARQFGVEE